MGASPFHDFLIIVTIWKVSMQVPSARVGRGARHGRVRRTHSSSRPAPLDSGRHIRYCAVLAVPSTERIRPMRARVVRIAGGFTMLRRLPVLLAAIALMAAAPAPTSRSGAPKKTVAILYFDRR